MKISQMASICGISTKSNLNEIELIRDIERPYKSDRCQMLKKNMEKTNTHRRVAIPSKRKNDLNAFLQAT